MLTMMGIISSSALAVPVPIYTGSLSCADGGILGGGVWITPGVTTLEWEVTLNPTSTHYKYTLTVPEKDISHFIIETSLSFTEADIFNATGPFGNIEVKLHIPQQGNPEMPADIYGIKFCDMAEVTIAVIEFDSTRRPVLGSFYAKDGKTGGIDNVAWNADFSSATNDDYKILVPDTTPVPEPATCSLLALGAIALILRKRL